MCYRNCFDTLTVTVMCVRKLEFKTLFVIHPVLIEKVKRFLYQHGLARRRVADGGNGLQIWSVATSTSINSRRQPKRDSSPASGFGWRLRTPHYQEKLALRNIIEGLEVGRILRHKWRDNIKMDLNERECERANLIHLAQDRI